MAGEGVDQVLESARLRIGQLELLVDHAKSVERVHADDRRELARNLIRVLTDIAIDADEMAALLSANAVHHKVLTPTEAAESARISRTAMYKRVAAFFEPEK